MTTNNPGSVDQNPYYDCAGCYDYQTHRAEDLRVHKDRAWCDSCWDYHKDGDEALPLWHELERFVPALQAEFEQLRKHLQNLIDQTTPLEPEPGNPMWSRRIQLDEVIAERDQLRAECEQLRKDAERYRWLRDPCSGAERVVMYGRGDYGRGLMRYMMLDWAIDAAMEATK